MQFQYYFKEVLAQRSVEQGEYLPIEEIQSSVNKILRIESLQPIIKNKYLKFRRDQKTLLTQLKEFPMGKNDDAPDGLQMAVQLAQTVKATASSGKYKSVIKMHLILQFSLKEIADMKGMEYSTVRSLYSRGIRKLRNSCLSLEEGGSDE